MHAPLTSLCFAAALLMAFTSAVPGVPFAQPSPFGPFGGFGPALFASVFNHRHATPLDKLYSRLESVLSQVKFYTEQADALGELLAVQRKALDEAILDSVGSDEDDHRQAHENQNDLIEALENQADAILADLNTNNSTVQELADLNVDNKANQLNVEIILSFVESAISDENKDISTVLQSVRNLKDNILTIQDLVADNAHESATHSEGRLNAVIARETRRTCETGKVTLTFDDRRVEYQYQNAFDSVPQVFWGLCGTRFDLDAKKESPFFNFGLPHSEPEAMGVRVHTYSTKIGLSIKAFELSFGNTGLSSVDICFQACTIGPGLGTVNIQ